MYVFIYFNIYFKETSTEIMENGEEIVKVNKTPNGTNQSYLNGK